MKLNHIALLALASAMALTATAQSTKTPEPDLDKVITLEKDFVPVEKKATKKNRLPQMHKVTPPAPTSVTYSDWAQPTDVPTSIPTLMPYGYRTAHNFSDKRGYFNVGGGTQANFQGNAGYRILDAENITASVWLQHCSTWNGRNASPLLPDGAERLKQQYNDNIAGADLSATLKGGTLTAGTWGHFDSFNYFGDIDRQWASDHKQALLEFNGHTAWEGVAYVDDHSMNYGASLAFDHASYDDAALRIGGININGNGAHEGLIDINAYVDYLTTDLGTLGLLFGAKYNYLGTRYPTVNTATGAMFFTEYDDDFWTFTVTPRYYWHNSLFTVQAGVEMLFGRPRLSALNHGHGDKDFHFAPQLNALLEITDGAAVFANITGGLTHNTLGSMAAVNRYSDPLRNYGNSYMPFDLTAGLNIGPFGGFSAKAYAGYGIFSSDLCEVYRPISTTTNDYFSITHYQTFKYHGAKIGGQIDYKYRSLLEAHIDACFAPGCDDDLRPNHWNKGYSMDYDGNAWKMNASVKVNPIRRLTLDAALTISGLRSYLVEDLDEDYNTIYRGVDYEDYIDLSAGASYRFDRTLTLWTRAGNLLNRRQDIMPGMGAQRINVMAGLGLVF